ncbi:hypothetical protein GOV12_07000 [Candidatus Pacearchaeota archaeon]|nr:hypothetical protein [Candidatus Pacearchaeota archaeon]
MSYIIINSINPNVIKSMQRFRKGYKGRPPKTKFIGFDMHNSNTLCLKDTPETRVYAVSLITKPTKEGKGYRKKDWSHTLVFFTKGDKSLSSFTKEEIELAQKMADGKISFRDVESIKLLTEQQKERIELDKQGARLIIKSGESPIP